MLSLIVDGRSALSAMSQPMATPPKAQASIYMVWTSSAALARVKKDRRLVRRLKDPSALEDSLYARTSKCVVVRV